MRMRPATRLSRWAVVIALGLGVTGSRSASAAEPEVRRVTVLDERGEPVAVTIQVSNGRATQPTSYSIHPECAVLRKAKDRDECEKNSPAPEFVLQVEAGAHGNDLLGRITFDDRSKSLRLTRHPQAQNGCFKVSLVPAEGTLADQREFFPTAQAQKPLCNSRPIDYQVKRRRKQVRITFAEDIDLASLGFGEKPFESDNPKVATIEAQTTTGTNVVEFTLVFQKETGDAQVAFLPLDHYPVMIEVPRAGLMQTLAPWEYKVEQQHITPHYRHVTFVTPASFRGRTEGLKACVQRELGPERMGTSSRAGIVQGTSGCLPCNEVKRDGASCPIWEEAGTNKIVHSDDEYEDRPECDFEDGHCTFADGKYFDKPISSAIKFSVAEDDAAWLWSGGVIIVERLYPSGRTDQQKIKFKVDPTRSQGSFTVYDENINFANDEPKVTYRLHFYHDLSSYPTARSALTIASDLDRAGLLTQTHHISGGPARLFPRFGGALRFKFGAQVPVRPRALNRRIGSYNDGRHGLGAPPPVFGIALMPEFFVLAQFPFYLLLGTEFEQVREWSFVSGASPTSTTQWRIRGLLGAGYRVSIGPVSGGIHLAWAPEAVPGQLADPKRRKAMMMGIHYGFDLLPQRSERLRVILGADFLFGSRTAFEFAPDEPQRVEVTTRVHFYLGFSVHWRGVLERSAL